MGTQPTDDGLSPSESSSSYDELVVNNQNLIDLDSSESDDFPFCGSPVEIEQEVRQVEQLLMKKPDGVHGQKQEATSRRQKRKPSAPKRRELPLASYGHSAERVQEIQNNNEILIKKLVGVANAPPSIKTIAAEHDKHIANVLASSVARRAKEEASIVKDNLQLYNKLQRVRPSADVDRKALDQDFSASRRYMPTTKRQQPKPTPPGLLQRREWNDRWNVKESSQ